MNQKDKKTTDIDFVSDTSTPPAGNLKLVTQMAEKLMWLDRQVENCETMIAGYRDEQNRIACADLPALMESIGLKEFKLSNGAEVVVKPIVKASLPSESAIERERDPDHKAELKERFERGLKYLSKLGAGAMIKNIVEVQLGKDSAKLAKLAVAALKKLGVTPTVSRGVHPQTLTAWVRERIEQGADVDFDLLAVYNGQKAEIKMAGEKKQRGGIDLGI